MIPYKKEDAVRVWPEGRYQATIASAEEKQSKAGNDMCEIGFDVYAQSGSDSIRVVDYIVYPKFVWKLKRLASALNAMPDFEAETFDPANYVGYSLTVELSIQAAREGYEERNTIAGYAPVELQPIAPKAGADIPF